MPNRLDVMSGIHTRFRIVIWKFDVCYHCLPLVTPHYILLLYYNIGLLRKRKYCILGKFFFLFFFLFVRSMKNGNLIKRLTKLNITKRMIYKNKKARKGNITWAWWRDEDKIDNEMEINFLTQDIFFSPFLSAHIAFVYHIFLKPRDKHHTYKFSFQGW